MERNVAALQERLAKATAGLTDPPTRRATAKIDEVTVFGK
jgi:hypothetical protein